MSLANLVKRIPLHKREFSKVIEVEAVVEKQRSSQDFLIGLFGPEPSINRYSTFFRAGNIRVHSPTLASYRNLSEGDRVLLSYLDVFCVTYKYDPVSKERKPSSKALIYRLFKDAKKL